MTPPPRDRWIVVWAPYWMDGVERPAIARWDEHVEMFCTGCHDGTFYQDFVRWPESRIAAWAECPARPGDG